MTKEKINLEDLDNVSGGKTDTKTKSTDGIYVKPGTYTKNGGTMVIGGGTDEIEKMLKDELNSNN